MGAAYFIVLDNDEPGFETFVNGKAIAKESEAIDKIAKELGLKTLDEMSSFADLEEEFDLPDELRETETVWLTAKQGLTWVRAIRQHIEANPKSVKSAKSVLGELAEYEELLEKVAKIKAKWHFEMDI
ncbi:MAG: hypothetical protein ACRC8S_23045 [Fimbriiglobus sp.]